MMALQIAASMTETLVSSILATTTLDSRQRHPEGLDNLALGRGAIEDELGGE